MTNFSAIAFFDVHELVASLRSRAGLFRPGPTDGRRIMSVRFAADPDEETPAWKVSPEWKKWPELRNAIARVERIANGTPYGPVERGRVFVEQLDPGCVLPWESESGPYYERHVRLHLPLRTNPRSMLYSGPEAFSPALGILTTVNVREPCSAVNLGEWPRVHLVIDLRKKEGEGA